jgi:hypothetical protein
MQSLNIRVPGKTISIDMRGGDMSIAIDPEKTKAAGNSALEWSNTLLDGEAVTYEDAQKAIADFGDGWRMPTCHELESLRYLSRHDPAIDTERYPDTQSRAYWTSTPCAWNDAAVWVVHFRYGYVYSDGHRSNSACVRAVRAGQ